MLLPFRSKSPQPDRVSDRQPTVLLLAASLRVRASATLTSSLKTRVGVFCRRAPGRCRARGPQVAQLVSGYSARGYKPASGRGFWLSRDPIQERGGKNLYAMVGNDAVNFVDPYGLKKLTKNEGESSLRAGLAMLETACDGGCKSGLFGKRCCTPEQCKADSKAIIEALVSAWDRNYGHGPYNDDGVNPFTGETSQTVGGYFCWDWAKIFADALSKVNPKCLSYEQGVAAAPEVTVTDLGLTYKRTPVHWYLRVHACKRSSAEFTDERRRSRMFAFNFKSATRVDCKQQDTEPRGQLLLHQPGTAHPNPALVRWAHCRSRARVAF